MKLISIITFVLVALLFTGCGNSVQNVGNPQYLPKNWLSVNESSWQFKELPEANKIELRNLKNKLARAQEGQYFSFYQKYSPEMLSELDSVLNNLNQAYFDMKYSNKAIAANLTPNMHGLAETYSDNDAGIIVVNNLNERMIVDDFRRATLLDKPSMLSPYPVVDN